ncbi:MAG: PIN domain-containing protein [Clostridium sp.]|nr:PIN domain-containing protein [Clostridium sp.]
MIYYAVFDTNVLVSSLLTKHREVATARVVDAITTGRIIPLYNLETLSAPFFASTDLPARTCASTWETSSGCFLLYWSTALSLFCAIFQRKTFYLKIPKIYSIPCSLSNLRNCILTA